MPILQSRYLIGSAHYLADFIKLISFRCARKQRSVRVHFGRYASNCPQIDGTAVNGGMQEYFRCSVPPRRDVIGIGRSGSDLTHQTEIRYLNQFRTGTQNILRLQISVKKSVPVYKGQPLQNLEYKRNLVIIQTK